MSRLLLEAEFKISGDGLHCFEEEEEGGEEPLLVMTAPITQSRSLWLSLRAGVIRSDKQLFLLLQSLRHRQVDLQRVGHNIRWGQGEPLRQRNILNLSLL